MVSEDVLKEMPVNGREACVQLVLLQEGGSVPPVKVRTISSCLQVHWKVVSITNILTFRVSAWWRKLDCVGARDVRVSYLFHVLLQSLLLLYNISERHMRAGHIPVVHEWHQTRGFWLALSGCVTICSSQDRWWLCPVSWPSFGHRWFTPAYTHRGQQWKTMTRNKVVSQLWLSFKLWPNHLNGQTD